VNDQSPALLVVLNAGSSSIKFSLTTQPRLEHEGADPTERAGRLSSVGSGVSAWGIPTDENAVIGRHALAILHRAT
jgi:acetate kinase